MPNINFKSPAIIYLFHLFLEISSCLISKFFNYQQFNLVIDELVYLLLIKYFCLLVHLFCIPIYLSFIIYFPLIHLFDYSFIHIGIIYLKSPKIGIMKIFLLNGCSKNMWITNFDMSWEFCINISVTLGMWILDMLKIVNLAYKTILLWIL